jgi:hypothetical protein
MFGRKEPLPDPEGAVKIPDHMRLPFKGKMAPPTTVLSPEARRAQVAAVGTRRRRKSFLSGLVAGPLLIVAMDLGGESLVRWLPDSVRFDPPIPLRALVFVAMTAGVLIAALIVFTALGLQAMGWMLGRGKGGLFGALARGVSRTVSAALALGLTLGCFAGTAWFMIPRSDWGRVRAYLEEKGRQGVERARELVAPPPR